MSDGDLCPAPSVEELNKLGELLSVKGSAVPKPASPFLRKLSAAFLLAPSLSDERTLLDDMVERVAAEEGVETEGMLRGVAVALRAEGLL